MVHRHPRGTDLRGGSASKRSKRFCEFAVGCIAPVWPSSFVRSFTGHPIRGIIVSRVTSSPFPGVGKFVLLFVGRPRVRETDELLLGLVDGLLWRKHKVRSAMPLFTLCVLGAVDANMRCSFLR